MRDSNGYEGLYFERPTDLQRRFVASVGILLLCLKISPVFAQVAEFGQITGLVTDPSGAVVAGASVGVTNQSTSVTRMTTTNADGYYVVPSLLPGTYDVTVSQTGFATETRSVIKLDIAEVARIDLTLSVGAVSQRITVQSSGALLQTQTASVGGVVSQSGVVDLPLNGRNYLQLSTLTPGVIATALSSQSAGLPLNQIVVNGGKNSTVTFMIDGADALDEWNSGTAFTPAPDAIQEFKIETNNMSAAYGGGGALINAVLKSGTNQFHGDVYEFFRNTSLNARNFFASTTPQLNQNQFGFTLGGPVKKDKAFFFVDYQGTRILSGQTFNTAVPTSAERNGDFTGVKQLHDPYTGQPLAPDIVPQISPQSSFFLGFIPLPNNPSGTYIVTTKSKSFYDQFDVRMDYQLRPSDSLTFTYSFMPGTKYTPSSLPTNGGLTANYHTQFAALAWTHNFGSNMLNEARVSYSRERGVATPQGFGTNYTEEAGIGGYQLTDLAYPGFPNLNISGYAGINGQAYYPLMNQMNPLIVGDVLSVVKGKHTLQIGGDARWFSTTCYNSAYSRGQFSFTGIYTGDGFADFLYGVPYQAYRDFPRNLFGLYQQNQDVFFQDTWKLTRRLTWIVGVRYDLIHPEIQLNDAASSTDIVLNKIIVASDSAGHMNTNTQEIEQYVLPLLQSRIVPSSEVGLGPSLVRADNHAFAPRMGLTYDLGHNFVVRTGYGIFYPLPDQNYANAGSLSNPPFIWDEFSNFNTTPIPSKITTNMFSPISTANLVLSPPTFSRLDPYLPDPYIQEWNFTIQKVMSKVLSLQVGYVGSKGIHESFTRPYNIPQPGPGAIQSRRLNSFFGSGQVYEDSAYSNYSALQVTGEMRAWHGLYLLAGYAWSKSLDLTSSDGNSAQNPYNLRDDYGPSTFNVPSRFTLSMTYDLPFLRNRRDFVSRTLGGWKVSNIITLQSGLPFSPTISTDRANTGLSQRPNRIGSGILANPTINEWFDVSAFALPAQYTYGTSGRDILSAPHLRNWDSSLFKTFVLSRAHEGIQAQFRGEFFNFTNTPYFGAPVTNIQAGTAGKILSAGSPRVAQLVLKVLF